MNSILTEIILWLLISAYGITWIWNLMASMPNPHKDIWEIFKLNNFSYSFWLISSLLLFVCGIIHFDNVVLSYILAIEMITIIWLYIVMVPKKHNQIKKYKKTEKKFKEECKKRYEY